MNKIRKTFRLSIGTVLCLFGTVSIAEFLFHFELEDILDFDYVDGMMIVQLMFYFLVGIGGIVFGLPLVVYGLQKIESENNQSST